LATLPPAERRARIAALIQEEAAYALGLASATLIPLDQPLQNLGLDSLMAVELRNRLGARCGTKLPATLLFDYPTTHDLARYLLEKVLPETPAAAGQNLSDEEIRLALASVPISELRRLGLLDQLLQLRPMASASDSADLEIRRRNIDEMGADDLISMFAGNSSPPGDAKGVTD
jgi:acyl carrier protein